MGFGRRYKAKGISKSKAQTGVKYYIHQQLDRYATYPLLCKSYGITPQQFNILRILRGQHGKPATIGILQERMLDKMSNASRLVEKLKQKALVDRKECPQDRRQMDVLITDKGLQLLKEIDTTIEKNQLFLNGISESEAQYMNEILDKLRS